MPYSVVDSLVSRIQSLKFICFASLLISVLKPILKDIVLNMCKWRIGAWKWKSKKKTDLLNSFFSMFSLTPYV